MRRNATRIAASIGLAVALMSGSQAFAEPPLTLSSQVTDSASVLGSRQPEITQRLTELQRSDGIQLYVAYVNTFDGDSGEDWAKETFRKSGMGGDDVLLAVAVRDRKYGTWLSDGTGLTSSQAREVRTQFIEPRLRAGDWAGAVTAAADGFARVRDGSDARPSQTSSSGPGGFSLWYIAIPLLIGAAVLVMARRAKARRTAGPQAAPAGGYPGPAEYGPPGETPETLESLRRRSAAALVSLDDAIRSSGEELAFAEAQFGSQATLKYRTALEEARGRSVEAFRLQHELDGSTADETHQRTVLDRVIGLSAEAQTLLDDQKDEFAALRDLQSRVPELLTELDVRVGEVRTRLPVARQQLDGLLARYPAASLQTIQANHDQAAQLVDASASLVTSGREHLTNENRAAAVVSARAAEQALGQASTLLDAIDRAPADLANVDQVLDARLTSISSDIADAHRLNADDPLTRQAVTAAEQAIAQGRAATDGGDPLAAVSRLERAEHDLDNALVRYREADAHRAKVRSTLADRFTRVNARLQSIDETIATRRGAVGPDARTRISEALRLYGLAVQTAESDPDQAQTLLTRAEDLGEEALRRAEEDQNSWRGGGGYGQRRTGGIDPVSMILGGILMGGGGHHHGGSGGSWGGDSGGFGGGWGGGGGGFGGGGSFGGGGGGGFGGGGSF